MTWVNVGALLTCFCIISVDAACSKQDDFLNAKPNAALSTISTVGDLQNILNDEALFNHYSDPELGTISSDEYYVTSSSYTSAITDDQNLYEWATQIFPAGETISEWDGPYQQIYNANIVLDAIPNISATESQLNPIKGEALFKRSIAFYNLLQTFTLPFDSLTADETLGLPIRLNSNLNAKSVRSSELQCYQQIIQDLTTALSLLPQTSIYLTRPNKVSTNALLARIYLALNNYSLAFKYANDALAANNNLTDFNTLAYYAYGLTVSTSPYLNEDLYHTTMVTHGIAGFTKAIVDSSLYNSYDSNDLRRNVFFSLYSGGLRFKGSYEFKMFGVLYSGLATDELYLIRAECYARTGNVTLAMNDLNTLLLKRWKTNTFVPYTAINADDALSKILVERRKELIFRGLRWTDLRRLNTDSRFAVTLKRLINGNTFTLPPNDPRYAMPIPDDEIQASGIQQNNR